MARAVLGVAFFFSLPCAEGRAQRPDSAVVELDHGTGAARLIVRHGTRADTSLLTDGTVRLSRRVPVEVVVVNTNTALYRFSLETTATPLPEMVAMGAFLRRMNPYLPAIRAAVTGAVRARGVAPEDAAAAEAARAALTLAIGRTERALRALDDAIHGANGLRQNHTSVLLALDEMRRGVAPEQASQRLRTALALGAPCQTYGAFRLPTAERLLTALAELAPAAQDVQGSLAGPAYSWDPQWVTLRDAAADLEERAHRALSDFEVLVADAYRVERLVAIVAGACSRWRAGVAQGTMTTGRAVSVRVEPRGEPETARLAERGVRTLSVTIQPRTVVRPALGVNAVAIPGARFPTYGTRPATGGVEIYESGDRDARYAFGSSLGFTWAGLDFRETSGVAVWVPDLLVTLGAVRGVGVGAGVSWSFLRLSAGAAWIQHRALDGTRPGDVVPDPSFLRLTERFSAPRFYLSLSVFESAPIARRLPR